MAWSQQEGVWGNSQRVVVGKRKPLLKGGLMLGGGWRCPAVGSDFFLQLLLGGLRRWVDDKADRNRRLIDANFDTDGLVPVPCMPRWKPCEAPRLE